MTKENRRGRTLTETSLLRFIQQNTKEGNVNISFINCINRCIKGGERMNPNCFLTKGSVRRRVAFNNPEIVNKRFRKSCYTYFA